MSDAATPSKTNKPRPWAAAAAGAAHGLLVTLAMPPVDGWPLVFVALLPLVWAALHGRSRPGKTGLWAAAGMLPFWLWTHRWVIPVTAVGYAPMNLFLSLFTLLFVWIVGRAALRFPRLPLSVAVPVVWAGLEFFRGSVALSGYPWQLLGHPLVEAGALAAPASALGAYFVSFLAAAVNGAIADAFLATPRRRRAACSALAAVAAVFALAAAVRSAARPPDGNRVRIALVQTNIEQDNKKDWLPEQRVADWYRFEDLTRHAAALEPKPSLIVWPESMFPGYFLDAESVEEERRAKLVWHLTGDDGQTRAMATTAFAARLAEVQAELGVPMLVGAIAADNLRIGTKPDGALDLTFDHRYNSAFLVRGGLVEEARYDKISLTPFGEVMPYISNWDWLERQLLAIGASGMSFNLSPGTDPTVFEVRSRTLGDAPRELDLRFAAPICFEIIRPEVCRDLVYDARGRRADLLVNISNYGWFGDVDAAREHVLQISRWRAVELGVPVVVAANTGISAVIDANGRVLASGIDGGGRARVGGVLTGDVPIPHPSQTTIFGKIGDLFGWTVFAAAATLGVVVARPRRKTDDPAARNGRT